MAEGEYLRRAATNAEAAAQPLPATETDERARQRQEQLYALLSEFGLDEADINRALGEGNDHAADLTALAEGHDYTPVCLADLRARLGDERVFVIATNDADDVKVCSIFAGYFLPLARIRNIAGWIVGEPLLQSHTEEAPSLLDALTRSGTLAIPPDAQAVLVDRSAVVHKPSCSRILMTGLIYKLAGCFNACLIWQKGEDDFGVEEMRKVKDIIIDFLMLMFYPLDKAGAFKSRHTHWTRAVKQALIKRYKIDLGYDPNKQMREIILALKADVEEAAKLLLGHKKVAPVEQGVEALRLALKLLCEKQRFDQYETLFASYADSNTRLSLSPSFAKHKAAGSCAIALAVLLSF